MRGGLTVRKVKTGSGATAVQVVRYHGRKCQVLKHIGSAQTAEECEALLSEAEAWAEAHRKQPSLFGPVEPEPTLRLAETEVVAVTHGFARDVLLACAERCGLGGVPALYRDLALMRIIEPVSKLYTIELLEQYFDVHYALRTVYRALPRLLEMQDVIEDAAIQTARVELDETFHLVLYDVTTLYFESFKEYDLQRPGFSKDNKPQQPQIVIGLITTRSGFPVMHEVFEGNTFEGKTMLEIVARFQARVGMTRPVIVADAAMLSKANMLELAERGYHYIVGARLANAPAAFIEQIHRQLPRTDMANLRFDGTFGDKSIATVCAYSDKRYAKDRREFDKQVKRALDLVARNEAGRRAKFVTKADQKGKTFAFNEALRRKTERLLGIKGYITNIPEAEMANADVIERYHDLWHVEQAFRMSKSDLRTRPIFHFSKQAIQAHVLLCFMALMIGKFIEIKTGSSLRKIRNALWKIHEVHLRDERTGKIHILRMNPDDPAIASLLKSLQADFTH